MNVADFESVPVQLAGQSKKIAPTLEGAIEVLTERGYAWEIKFDGVRCMAIVDNGVVALINRRHADITFRYPEIRRGLEETFAGRSIVLDGELICIGADGKPDFAAIHLRDAQSKPIASIIQKHPATYMTFDVLCFEGDDIRQWPWKARNALAKVEAERSTSRFIEWSTASLDGVTMWEFVRAQGLEGLIAKNPKLPYRGGDRNDWIKLKQAFTVSCVVARWDRATAGKDRPAYNVGKGARANRIGALNLTLSENGQPVDFGQCGTGFTDTMLADLKTRLDAGQVLVVDVEVNAVTKDRKPRHPTYRGIRMDVAPADCTVQQLADMPVI